jgi:hypothetical protein
MTVVLFHGTDDRAAELVEREGLRPGSYLTDSVRWARHYARRSAGAARSAGAILAIEVPGYAGYLRGGPIDPDAIGSAVWLAAVTLAAKIIVRVPRERQIMPEDAEWYRAIGANRALRPRPRITDPRHGRLPG